MAGDRQLGPAPDLGVSARAPLPHLAAGLRRAIDLALAGGAGPGQVYAEVVRPALADLPDAHAALAELALCLPITDEGLGRRAAVLVPAGLVGELDGRALADALEAGGWTALVVTLDADPDTALAAVQQLGVEVVALPAADGAQVAASAELCSLLRRSTAPPLIVGVVFDPAATGDAVAADHVIGTTDALAALLRRRIAAGAGTVAWGVRLHRDAAALVVAPVGQLNAETVGRLREIVETRRALYERIVIDLRDLLEPDAPGLAALVSWNAEQPWDPTVAALSDPRTLTALRRAGLTDALPLATLTR